MQLDASKRIPKRKPLTEPYPRRPQFVQELSFCRLEYFLFSLTFVVLTGNCLLNCTWISGRETLSWKVNSRLHSELLVCTWVTSLFVSVFFCGGLEWCGHKVISAMRSECQRDVNSNKRGQPARVIVSLVKVAKSLHICSKC